MSDQDPILPGQEPIGRKGGAAESFVGPAFYEPRITAVTDIVVPASRIQWGPVTAGLLITLSIAFLFRALGVALSMGATSLGYWTVGFSCLGLFLGALFATRTARAPLMPALYHAVVLWSLVLVLDVVLSGSISAAVVGSMTKATATTTTAAAGPNLGWWFFLGYIIMLAASLLGSIAGAVPEERREETVIRHTP